MSYSVSNLKNDLSGVLHGTTNNQIQNLNGVINRAARQLLLDLDPQETKRTVEFVAPIFNSIYDYPIAADVKGNKIIDIFPTVQRIPQDIWSQSYNQAFDVAKQNILSMQNMFTMNFNTAVKTIRINAPWLNPPIILNQADNITSNGTWVLTGDGTGLAVDNTNFVSGGGSLQFTFNASGTLSILKNSTMTAVDLTDVANQSSMFFWIYFTDASVVNHINLFWGNDVSNVWGKTSITTNQQGNAFVNGWNLIEVLWTATTVIGSPNASAVDYLEVDIYATTVTAQVMRINLFEDILGTVLNYEYYSKYMFRDSSTGAFQETVTDDSNLINLDTDSYNVLFNLVAYLAIQQQQGLDATFYDGTFFQNEYQKGLARYKAMYKSELQKPQSVFYRMPFSGYGRWFGGINNN